MPIIWGFNLNEMRWSAFSSKNMFDGKYNLRSERFIIFQLAMLICLAAECIATYSLTKYEHLQDHIESFLSNPAHLYQNDIIDVEIVTIIFCVLVATLYGTDFFFLLMFPRRIFPRWYQNTKKFLAVIITLGTFAAALSSSIIIARNSAKLDRTSPQMTQSARERYSHPPFKYSEWGVNIAWLVLLWIGLIFVAWSTYLMFIADKYDLIYGTEPKLRFENGVEKNSSTIDSTEEVLPMSDRSHV